MLSLQFSDNGKCTKVLERHLSNESFFPPDEFERGIG
jgi:hypothetical protein